MTCQIRFDLILIDHLKSLYPRELRTILARELLAEDGVILLHDVLHKAATPWDRCTRLCTRFGYSWELYPEIPAGAALVRAVVRSPRHKLLAKAYSVGLQLRYKAGKVRSALYRDRRGQWSPARLRRMLDVGIRHQERA